MRFLRSIELLVIVYAVGLNSGWTGFAQGSQPLGMILQVDGQVTLQRGSAARPAQLAELLYAGNRIIVPAQGRVTFSFCPTRERFVLNGGSDVTVGADSVHQSKGALASRVAGPNCSLPKVALGDRDVEQFGITAPRDPLLPIAIYLAGNISTPRPLFTWAPVISADTYELNVTRRGESVWTAQYPGDATEARLPDTQPQFEPGAYRWELTARKNGNALAQGRANFEIKPDSAFSSSLPPDTASRLERATELDNAGYCAEAAAIYRILRSANSTDLRFTRELIWLYGNAGLITATSEELKNYKAQKERQ